MNENEIFISLKLYNFNKWEMILLLKKSNMECMVIYLMDVDVIDNMKCVCIITATTVWNTGETGDINIMSCPIKANSNTIELTVHASCYWVLDLICVIISHR